MRLRQTSPLRSTLAIFAIAVLTMVGIGCATVGVPDMPADATGPVLEVSASGSSNPSRFLVEEYEGDTLVTAAWVRIDDATTILVRSSSGEDVQGSATAIAPGVLVQVWFEGPVAESWPLQAIAGTVLVLE